jgi:hypothetical protein
MVFMDPTETGFPIQNFTLDSTRKIITAPAPGDYLLTMQAHFGSNTSTGGRVACEILTPPLPPPFFEIQSLRLGGVVPDGQSLVAGFIPQETISGSVIVTIPPNAPTTIEITCFSEGQTLGMYSNFLNTLSIVRLK